jgi:uroporphyrinogen decarboxylase
MNPQERVRAALTRRQPDRLPKALAFWEEELPALPDTSDTLRLDVRYVDIDPPPEQGDFLAYLRRLPADVHVGNLRQLRTYHQWDYHPERGPRGPLSAAQTLSDFSANLLPALVAPGSESTVARKVSALHAKGFAVAGSPPHLGGELFETAYRLRGFETFLEDLRLRPELAHYLLDQLAALALHSSVILARGGVDVLLLDDDVAMSSGMIVGPATWREFFKPRFAEIIRSARSVAPEIIVFYHSDGDFSLILADLVDIGVDVINPIQPDCMDAEWIKREFGGHLAMWGTVGTAALWEAGTPEAIRAEVRQRARSLGPEGLLLCPAYDVDFAPAKNLLAFAEAVEQFQL